MEQSVELSIIVPVYNMMSDGKLDFCMKSLLAQDTPSFEIIAVDDKSTDNSLDYLYQLQKKYPNLLRVLAGSENKRQGGAKNAGLEIAKGKWIGFVDSDDWVATSMYSKLLKKAYETGADIVGCDYCLKEIQDFVPEKAERNNSPQQTGELTDEKKKLLFLEPGSMVIKIYKRELFEEPHLRFPEKMFYEDNCLGVFPFLYAKRFELVQETLYFYYQHTSSTVHHISIDRCHDRMKAMELFLEEGKNRDFYNTFKNEMDYKVFELGYLITLLSYIQSKKHYSFRFLKELQKYLKTYVPSIEQNPYFLNNTNPEYRKFTLLHRKSVLMFTVYYKVLQLYRGIRYGK